MSSISVCCCVPFLFLCLVTSAHVHTASNMAVTSTAIVMVDSTTTRIIIAVGNSVASNTIVN